ncbi:zinc finger protein 761-like [Cydia splendana]|uniref:zinc finger protein 761-like n=1 Tax=Cydia splendana TaxID=1100963 RepID=UPI00300D59CB
MFFVSVANQIGFTKRDPLQKCEVQHNSISDQNQSPESQTQNAAGQRMNVAGTPQDIDEVFECETCGKTFNKIFYFTSHMQLHEYNLKIVETKTYSCETCGKQFETKKLLREHELTHVTRDYREYSCEFCGKTFGYMYQLTSHTRVHTGEKPYKCTMCTRRFAWTSSLACHERSHTRQKPDVSNVCDKGFGYYRMDDHRLPKAVLDSMIDRYELAVGKRKRGGQHLLNKDVRHLSACANDPERWEDNRLTSLDTKRQLQKIPKPSYVYSLNEAGQFYCHRCNRVFKTKVGLSSHIRAHVMSVTKSMMFI